MENLPLLEIKISDQREISLRFNNDAEEGGFDYTNGGTVFSAWTGQPSSCREEGRHPWRGELWPLI